MLVCAPSRARTCVLVISLEVELYPKNVAFRFWFCLFFTLFPPPFSTFRVFFKKHRNSRKMSDAVLFNRTCFPYLTCARCYV